MSVGLPHNPPIPEFAAPIPMTTRQISDDWVQQTRGLRIDRDGYSPQLEQNSVARNTIVEENMVCCVPISFSWMSRSSWCFALLSFMVFLSDPIVHGSRSWPYDEPIHSASTTYSVSSEFTSSVSWDASASLAPATVASTVSGALSSAICTTNTYAYSRMFSAIVPAAATSTSVSDSWPSKYSSCTSSVWLCDK